MRMDQPAGTLGPAVMLLLVVAGCTSSSPPVRSGNAVPVLQRINDAAQRCWIKSGDTAFDDYRVVPELDTQTGKPRILMLRAGKSAGLPVLVIEAENGRIDAYGPVQNSPLASRINRDIVRWGNGGSAC